MEENRHELEAAEERAGGERHRRSDHHREEHHHSSRHHSGSHRRSWKKQWKSYYRKHRKALIAWGIAASVLAMALLIWAAEASARAERASRQPSPQESVGAVREETGRMDDFHVGLPLSAEPYALADQTVLQYMTAGPDILMGDIISLNPNQNDRLDAGRPVTLAFDMGTLLSDGTVRSAGVELSESPSFEDTWFTQLDSGGNASFYNLKTGWTYSYRLILTLPDRRELTFQGAFETMDSPRLLNIGGICNVRDIGGWKTASGKQIRQGLLYRGTEVDGAVNRQYLLTDSGVNEMTHTLGVKTDLDLRPTADQIPGRYVLGSVRHVYYPIDMYENIFGAHQDQTVRGLFAELADPEIYPAYLHCTYGKDRTGVICYLLEAILGLSEENLMREYELSALCYPDMTRADITPLIEKLRTYPGETMQQKAESYLLSVGVTPEEIRSIRAIFLE